jgi:hypothetical protein
MGLADVGVGGNGGIFYWNGLEWVATNITTGDYGKFGNSADGTLFVGVNGSGVSGGILRWNGSEWVLSLSEIYDTKFGNRKPAGWYL